MTAASGKGKRPHSHTGCPTPQRKRRGLWESPASEREALNQEICLAFLGLSWTTLYQRSGGHSNYGVAEGCSVPKDEA